MKKIYSKDECAPDALGALEWLAKEIGSTGFLDSGRLTCPHITIDPILDDTTVYLFGIGGCCYWLEYSCGIYEDLFEISLEEMIAELSRSAIEFCILNRCLKRFGDIEIRGGLAFRGNDPIQFKEMLDVVEGHPELWRSEPIPVHIAYVEVLMLASRFGPVCVGLRLVQ